MLESMIPSWPRSSGAWSKPTNLSRIYLFGSKARDQANPDSDYDIMVIIPDSAPSSQRRSRLAYEVLRGTGTAVDVLVSRPRESFEKRLHLQASLPSTIQREGKLLYGA